MNQSYRGRSDGITTWLRTQSPPEAYLGIEVEVSQGLILDRKSEWPSVRKEILEAFGYLAAQSGNDPAPPASL